MWSLRDYWVITLRPNSGDTTRRAHLQSDNRRAYTSTFPTSPDPAPTARAISEPWPRLLHSVRFHGMIPGSTFRLKRPGTLPDGIPERLQQVRLIPLLEGGCAR